MTRFSASEPALLHRRAMWLPKPLYDALPAIYVLVGVLFVSGAIYLGFVHEAAPAYAGIGAVCVLSGLLVRKLREQSRKNDAAKPPAKETSDR